MENNVFTYSYSAEKNREVESIRRKYLPKEESKLETLRRLDLSVQSAGMIESLCLGVIGSLIFGIGMCFFLNVFSGGGLLAALFMLLGILMMLPAYPLYKHIAKRTRERLTPKILSLSDEIINQ